MSTTPTEHYPSVRCVTRRVGRRTERTLMVDADDTLWENNIFYLRCTRRFQDFMETLGFKREDTLTMLDLCERETILRHGYGATGYVTALGMACERLLQQTGRQATPELLAQVRAFGDIVLSPPMILRPAVEETLTALRPTSELVLVTKGNEAHQQEKIDRSGLGPLFDALYIVEEKDVETYRAIAAELGLDPHCTWMIGNSPRSDINPAIRAGLGAILIPHDHTWTAELQELEHPELVITLQRFAELLPFFGIDEAEEALS